MRTFYRRDQPDDLRSALREGMAVYDRNGRRVGVVEFVQLTDENPDTPGADTVGVSNSMRYENRSAVSDVMASLSMERDLPENLRSRLMRDGYVRIDGGFLAPDSVATFDQIASISEDAVTLNVRREDLIVL